MTHDIDVAVQFGNLALKLLERAPDAPMTPRVFVMVYVHIPPRSALTTTLQPLLETYHLGLSMAISNPHVWQPFFTASITIFSGRS